MILGDMFELGQESQEEHKAIIKLLLNQNEVKCYFVGSAFYANRKEQDNFCFYNSFEDFSNATSANEFINSSILIKGSRGMALERTLDFIS